MPPARTATRRQFLSVAGSSAAALAAVSGLSSCRGLTPTSPGGSGGTGALSMMFWSEGKRAQLHLKVIEQFEQTHAGTKVTPQYQGLQGYDDKLATRISGKNPPSIFELRAATFSEYIERGVVRKLDGLVPDPLPFDGLPENLKAACQLNGAYYAIPLGVATLPAVVYNKTLIAKLGIPAPKATWTMDDLAGFAAAIHKADPKLYGCSDMGGSSGGALQAYLRSDGKDLFTTDGALGFSADDLSAWYQFWDDMRKAKSCPPMQLTQAATGFNNNEVVKGQAGFKIGRAHV